ncbi:MAG: MGMT family protein [Deltaproteobacteria bacterium]|jgi:methylated-DNA-protein-cysteine methyltransferase-like protein|nr:MGMT family protein [Deltaproteobacteria bacterium]
MKPRAKGWQSVYRIVRRIPAGRVATYGQVAALAGMPGAARQGGWALSALAEDADVPWQRVINAMGRISRRAAPEIEGLQRSMLEAEGVDFDRRGRVDLSRFAWKPESRRGAG